MDGARARTGKPVEIATEVVGELVGGAVAAGRVLVQRLHHDRVEVAAERPLTRHRRPRGRPGRLRLHDGLHDLAQRRPLNLVGALAREKLVEQDAEGIDVGRRRNGVAGDLLRRRVLRREVGHDGPRHHSVALDVEQLRDPEVEQDRSEPTALSLGHEHVGRLEITVDDQVTMRIPDGLADLDEQPDAGVDAEFVVLGIRRDGLALDVLHHQIRHVVADAAIDEPRDARVLEAGQDLALPLELAHALGAEQRQPLERRRLLVGPVSPLDEVDGAHTAAPDLALDAPRPEPLAGRARLILDELGRRALVEEGRLIVGRHHGLDLAA